MKFKTGIMAAVLLAACLNAKEPPPVAVSLISQVKSFVPGQAFTVGLLIRHAQGWHTYYKDPGDAGLPTTLEWKLPKDFSAGPVLWPRPVEFKDPTGLKGYGYTGEAVLAVEIKPAKTPADSHAVLQLHAAWLACREVCIPGSQDLSLDLPAAAKAGSSQDAGRFPTAASAAPFPLGLMLGLALLGGLLLNLMPCVLPVLSLKVVSLARQAGQSRAASLSLGLAFMAGVLASFWTLAALVTVLKAGGTALGWGFQFQSPGFVVFMAAVVLVFSLSLFGVFEITLPGRASTGLARAAGNEGLAGAFLNGAFTTLLATPCTAPFLGTALGFAFSQPGWVLFLVFTVVGLGLALPYLALALLPSGLSRLPKPGAWMETLKQAMGFPLLATLVWLLWLLGRQAGLDAAARVMVFLLVLALACWLLGRMIRPGASRIRRILAWAFALAFVLAGVWFGLMPVLAREPANQRVEQGDWIAWSPEGMRQLNGSGKTVFLDFTADWCWTCKVNEKVVLETPAFKAKVREQSVVLVKADWTSQDEGIARLLASFGRSGVPFYVVYPAGHWDKPLLLPEVLTTAVVMQALDKARAAEGGP